MKMKNAVIFFIVFSVDVNVRAVTTAHFKNHEMSDFNFVTEPENCDSTSGACTFRFINKFTYKTFGLEFTVDKNSTVLRSDTKNWALVSGSGLFKSSNETHFQTPYGIVTAKKGAQFLFEKKEASYFVQVLFGSVILEPKGGSEKIEVLEGYSNFLAQVGEGSKAQVGVPQAIVVNNLIKKWGSYFVGTKKEFRAELEKFLYIHEKAKVDLADLNQKIVERELASFDEKKRRHAQKLESEKEFRRQKQEKVLQRLLGE